MATFYWFALIVGGGLLAVSFMGDLFGTEVDDAGSETEAVRILSLRNLTYFLFGFGATGLVLGWLGQLPALVVAIVSLVVGAAAAGSASALLGFVARRDSGAREGDESFVGCVGRVVLPVGSSRPGKVIVRRGAREYELSARPFGSAEGGSSAAIGCEVVVVEMSGGTALVTPLEESPALRGANA